MKAFALIALLALVGTAVAQAPADPKQVSYQRELSLSSEGREQYWHSNRVPQLCPAPANLSLLPPTVWHWLNATCLQASIQSTLSSLSALAPGLDLGALSADAASPDLEAQLAALGPALEEELAALGPSLEQELAALGPALEALGPAIEQL